MESVMEVGEMGLASLFSCENVTYFSARSNESRQRDQFDEVAYSTTQD